MGGVRRGSLLLAAAVRHALAGWPFLLPALVISVIVAAALVVVTALVAAGAGAPDPGGGGDTSLRPQPLDPGGGGGDGDGGGDGVQPRPGTLEIGFDARLDFREIGYTLRYRAGEPEQPGEQLYLHALRDPEARVEAVAAQHIAESLASGSRRYAGLLREQAPLCRPGLALSAARPSCQGSLRIAPSWSGTESVRSVLDLHASTAPPLGPLDVDGQGAAVVAQAALRLVNSFFLVSSGPPSFQSRLSRVEQDADNPEVFRVLPPEALGEVQAAGEFERLELSRDRSRLYLLTRQALSVWPGLPEGPRLLYVSDASRWLQDAVVTPEGVCVAYAGVGDAGLRCLRQDEDNWGPAQRYPQPMQVVDAASAGSSVMLLGHAVGNAQDPMAYLVPDSSQRWLEFVEVPAERAGAVQVEGVVGLRQWPGGRSDFLLFGSFAQARHGLWQVAVSDSLSEQGVPWFVPSRDDPADPLALAGAHGLREMDLWEGIAPGVVRVLALSGSLAQVDYDYLDRRPLAMRTPAAVGVLRPARLDTLRLLDAPRPQRIVAVAGVRQSPPRSFVVLLRYADAGASPQIVSLLDMSDPALMLRPLRLQVRVRGISANAMVLRPEASQADAIP